MSTRATLIILAFSLSALPAAAEVSISPGLGEQGATLHLLIQETEFDWDPANIDLSLGDGIILEQIDVIADGIIHARIGIESTAQLGARDLVMLDPENFVMAPGIFEVAQSGGYRAGGVNAMENPGFEDGDLGGWIPTTWTIDTLLPHGGDYDAYDPGGSGGGGQCIRQNFDPPIDSNTALSFTFWIRQPDDFGIAQVIVFHQIGGVSVGVAFTNDDDSWTFEDHTGLIFPNDMVTGIHVCGFGGGQQTPDDSWVDDFSFEIEGEPTATETVSWGRIKSLKR